MCRMSHTFWRVSRVELFNVMFCFLATIKVAPDTSTLAGGKVEGGGIIMKLNEPQSSLMILEYRQFALMKSG